MLRSRFAVSASIPFGSIPIASGFPLGLLSVFMWTEIMSFLFGCPSFAGLGTALRTDSFGLLYQRYLPPAATTFNTRETRAATTVENRF